MNGAIEEDESAVKAKKNQAEAKSNFAALSLEDEGEEEQDEDTTPPRQASSKGKKNKKKGGSVFAALDDDPELDAGRTDPNCSWLLMSNKLTSSRHLEYVLYLEDRATVCIIDHVEFKFKT